jgi:hypothetical protein
VAASAAADILSFGNYAVAFAESVIHFHGVRSLPEAPVTAEAASGLLQSLKIGNDRHARDLARRSHHRFIHRLLWFRQEFKAIRALDGNSNLSDLDCLLKIIESKISEPAKTALAAARERNVRYSKLSDAVSRSRTVARVLKAKNRRRYAVLEAEVLKSIISYEMDSNQGQDWTFGADGLYQLVNDFLLFDEYINQHGSARLKALCVRWGSFFLSDEASRRVDETGQESRDDLLVEMVKPILLPLWLFFVALCYSLQEGEYTLQARDAYWLGLIDEVVGATDLPNMRLVMEVDLSDPPAEPGS